MELLIAALIFGVVGGLIAQSKNRSVVGWAIGSFLMPLVILILICIPKEDPTKRTEVDDLVDAQIAASGVSANKAEVVEKYDDRAVSGAKASRHASSAVILICEICMLYRLAGP